MLLYKNVTKITVALWNAAASFFYNTAWKNHSAVFQFIMYFFLKVVAEVGLFYHFSDFLPGRTVKSVFARLV